MCQLIFANPKGFKLQFLPKKADKRFKNPDPVVEYDVNPDGSVSNVKIIKGTGSPSWDAGLIKSIQSWKYKPPQPGCLIHGSVAVTVDLRP